MGHFSEQNFYEILEVSQNATTEEIQKAFFKAKSTYSPTSAALYSVFSEAEAKELLKMIDEAYSILSNTTKRKDYDVRMFGKPSAGVSAEKSPGGIVAQPDEMLPDFMLPAESPPPKAPTSTQAKLHAVTATSVATPAPAVPAKKNTGRTIMSHYNVDSELEREIHAQETFDGTFLQKVRLYKNISIDQLAETSRISRPYLIAVETNDFHSLPAAVYVRGFIASVAKLLGLDEKRVVASYMKLFKDSRSD